MNVALYARVASTSQTEKESSISGQLKALRKYVEDRDWKIYQEFVDEAESRAANRPAFHEMIAISKQTPKPFGAILVWKLSRFARNREDSIIYKSLLRRRGISVISIHEPIDENPTGRLIESIITILNEFYSINLSEDTKRGMMQNIAQGCCNGGKAPIGYKKVRVMDSGRNGRTKFELDEILAPVVQRIFQMGIDGMRAKDIVNTLNNEGIRTNLGKFWNKNLIYSIWRNERYTGTQLWNKTSRSQGEKGNPRQEIVRYPNSHSAIVDYETFYKMQKIREERNRPKS